MQNTPAFRSNRIADLFENANGDLLVATSENLIGYRQGQFHNLTDAHAYRNNNIVSIHPKDAHTLVIFCYNDKVELISSHDYRPIQQAVDNRQSQKRFPFAVPDSVSAEIKKDFKRLANANEWQYLVHRKQLLMMQEDSLVFWFTRDNKLTLYNKFEIITQFDLSAHFTDKNQLILFQSDQSMYVMDRVGSGLVTINLQTRAVSYRALPKPCKEGSLTCAYVDREKNLWLGSSSCGLFKVKPDRFRYVDHDQYAVNRNIYPVAQTARGQLLLGSYEDGILVFDSVT